MFVVNTLDKYCVLCPPFLGLLLLEEEEEGRRRDCRD